MDLTSLGIRHLICRMGIIITLKAFSHRLRGLGESTGNQEVHSHWEL